MQAISIVLLPNMLASSITLPLEMFNAAFALAKSQKLIKQLPTIQFLSETLEPISTSASISISPNQSFNHAVKSDLILVPALWRNPLKTMQHSHAAKVFLQHQVAHSRFVCAVGTGSTLLAEAGLLHNRPATTHWYYFDAMEKAFPEVIWQRQYLITQSDNIFCAGSVNSIADLCVLFIEQLFNRELAQRVERQFSPEVRQSYQNHLFNAHFNNRHSDELIAQVQHSIGEQAQEKIAFATLAQKFGISLRQLQRRFKKATGLSPLQYQHLLRIETSKGLLINSNESIHGIAELAGFSSPSEFARLFKRHMLQTPLEYRQTVRSKLFNPEN